MKFVDYILDKYATTAEEDINLLPKNIKPIMAVLLAHFPIGNGGYRFFFERPLSGKASYEDIKNGYLAVGLPEAAQHFESVLSLFPKQLPPINEIELDRLLCLYFESEDEFGNAISTYSQVVEEAENYYFDIFDSVPNILQKYYDDKNT